MAFIGFFLVVVPLVFVASPALRPDTTSEGGAASQLLIEAYVWVGAVMLVVVPFALFWLSSAQHIKRHGRLDTIGMLRAQWPALVSVLRDWIPLVALLYCYGLMGPVIGHGLFGDQDEALARIDRVHVLRARPPRPLRGDHLPAALEWLSACYVFYAPLYPVVLAAVFAKKDPAPFRELAFALTLVLATGYVLYTVVPAQGPLFVDRFDVSLDGYYGAWLKSQLMDRTRVPRDCFPSLHTAVSLTLLWGALRHVRRLGWALLPIVVSIPVACVYLRYHYVVDVLAGLALFAAVATLTVRSRGLQAAFRRTQGG